MNPNQQDESNMLPFGGQYPYGNVGNINPPFGPASGGPQASPVSYESASTSPSGLPSPWAQPPHPGMYMQPYGFGMSTTPVSSPPQNMFQMQSEGLGYVVPGSYQVNGPPGSNMLANPAGLGMVAKPAGPFDAPPGPPVSPVPPSEGDAAEASSSKKSKPAVMLRTRRKERKTPARPFAPSRPLIPILDTMTPEELSSARAHNTRVAAERKENERRRNNQSAKRARIRKMATAVSLGDEITRLRGELGRARAEADMWKGLAYQRSGPDSRYGGNDNEVPPPPMLPPIDSDWAMSPLGPPPQGQHILEDHYAEEVEDMRRCLKEYVHGEDLVEICTQEFHDEIAAVLRRGDEIRAGLFPGGLEEDNALTQPGGAATAGGMDESYMDEADN